MTTKITKITISDKELNITYTGIDPVKKYKCDGIMCVEDSDGQYITSNCNNECVQMYSCDTTTGECKMDNDGSYTKDACSETCKIVKTTKNAYYYHTVATPDNIPPSSKYNLIKIDDTSTNVFSQKDIIYFDKSDPYSKDLDIDIDKWYETIYGSWLSDNIFNNYTTNKGVKVSNIFNNNFELSDSIKKVVDDIKGGLGGDAENFLFYNRFSLYDIPENITWGLAPITDQHIINYNPFLSDTNYIIGQIAFIDDSDPLTGSTTINNLKANNINVDAINEAVTNGDVYSITEQSYPLELYNENILLIYCPSTSYKGYCFAYFNQNSVSLGSGNWFKNYKDYIISSMTNKTNYLYTDNSNIAPVEYHNNILKLNDYNKTVFSDANTKLSDLFSDGKPINLGIVMYNSDYKIVNVNLLNSISINIQHPFIAHGNNSTVNRSLLSIYDIFTEYDTITDSQPYINENLKLFNKNNIYTTKSWVKYNVNYSVYSVINYVELNKPTVLTGNISDYVFYPTSTNKSPDLKITSTTPLFILLKYTMTKKSKKTGGGELPVLTCDNPFGTTNAGDQPKYPIAMFTPYIDLGLYPPELSDGGGYLWPDNYITTGGTKKCLEGNTYINTGSYGSEQGGESNTSSYMTDMFSGTIIPGNRFITLAFLVSAEGYVQQGQGQEINLNIRPCFGGVNTSTQVWMYDTMANYYWDEDNSLDKWIGSMRTADNRSDIILSYGGYNNRMSADTLWNIFTTIGNKDNIKLTEINLCDDIANNIGLKELNNSNLEKYGILDVNSEHDKDNNYQWGYTGKDNKGDNKKPDETQYDKNLYACYYLPMKYYKVRWLDFDVEAAAIGLLNWQPQILRIIGLRKLMTENPNVYIRYTFPTFPNGLNTGYPILYLTMYAFQNCDVSIRRRLYINLMTMDYGDISQFGFINSTSTGDVMGVASLFAVCNTVLQMQKISETIYKGKSNAKDYWLMNGDKITKWEDSYYAHIGNTPMTGLNDNVSEMFSPVSAKVLEDFVNNSKTYKIIPEQINSTQIGVNNISPLWTEQKYMGGDNNPPLFPWVKYDISGSQSLYDYLTANTGGFTNGSGHIAMWSLQRDTPCDRGEGDSYVSTSCSSSNPEQTIMEFSQIFQNTQNKINGL